MFLIDLVAALLIAVILRVFEVAIHNWRNIQLAFFVIRHPRTRVRVSVGTLCAFVVDNKYLLVQQRRRRDQLGPLGGAIHVFDEGIEWLRRHDFEIEEDAEPHWEGSNAFALRGWSSSWRLIPLRHWIAKSKGGLESFGEAIQREVFEELPSEGRPFDNSLAFGSFNFLRRVQEKPHVIRGLEIWQWRYQCVFSFVPRGEGGREFVQALRDLVARDDNFEFVTEREIKAGRSDSGAVIGDHAEYLLGKKARRVEIPWRASRRS